MHVNRQELLQVLEKLKPSISKEEVNGMNYFLFSKTSIITYNDKISIQYPFKTDFQFFVNATNFYKLLSKSTAKEINLSEKEGKLNVRTNTMNVSLPTIIDDEVFQRVRSVSKSLKESKWKTLPKNFVQCVFLCAPFSSTQESDRSLTYVYINESDCIASDNNRIAHVNLSSPMPSMFIKASGIKLLSELNPIKYSVNKSWVHFKNEDGCVFSIRVVKGSFPDFLPFFDFKGIVVDIPNDIVEGLNIASIFVDDHNTAINVDIVNNTITISIKSDAGKSQYRSRIAYDKSKISFSINIEFLKQMLSHSSFITVSKDKLRLESDNKFSLVTALYGS